MEELKLTGNHSLSIINDPFSKRKITRVYVSVFLSAFSKEWSADGSVEFQNGNTKGEQRFKGANFDEIVLKIKAMIDNLE